MWARSVEEAFFQTCEWLDLCARNGITLNPKKFQFAQDTVEFAGLTVTSENIKPNHLGGPRRTRLYGHREAWRLHARADPRL